MIMKLINKTWPRWNNNGTITYQQVRIWKPDEEKTVGSLDDEVKIWLAKVVRMIPTY